MTEKMTRMIWSLPLSERVIRGLEVIEESRLRKKPAWGEGMSVLDEETVKLPLVKRKALAIKKIFSEMPMQIKSYELLIGDIIQSSVMARMPFPEYATQEEVEAASHAVSKSIFGHNEVYYPGFLQQGLSGIRATAERKLAAIDAAGIGASTGPGAAAGAGAGFRKREWYESVLISLEGLETYIRRYRDLALTLAQDESVEQRRSELEEIAGICGNLLTRAPETFREALQAYWFAYAAVNCTGNPIAFGRFDQNLGPFLEKDLANGRLTPEAAQELIDLFWLKINERLQLLEVVTDPATAGDIGKIMENPPSFGRGRRKAVFLGGKTTQDRATIDETNYNQFYSNMALSGLTPDGSDGTNALTYLALNATYRLKLVQPEMYVRLHNGSPPELIERSADLIRAGLANPNIFNDDVIIPGFVKAGLPEKAAREYTSDGCWEPHPQGRTWFAYARVSAIECLDRTLFPRRWAELEVPGYSADSDPFRDLIVPDPRTYTSFDDVMDTFKAVLDTYIRGYVKCVADFVTELKEGYGHFEINPQPLFSALAKGPLDSGRDITQGGMEHTQYSAILVGLSHTADSLAVIKKLCFEEKAVDWKELLDALEANWEGNESLRRLVKSKSPAYGNDEDYVDEIAREIVEIYVESMNRYRRKTGTDNILALGIATFEGYAAMGYLIGATPDGRLAKEMISSNASPSVGRAVNGQTAAINSYLKLPHIDLPLAAALDLAMPRRPGVLSQVETLITTFIERKGSLLTISVNDCEVLKAAQKEPEKHRDLKVRVGGWEAYFVDLSRPMQDWQIRKCEQYA